MKKLLIHNNNTFLNQTDYFNIEEQFVFGFNTDNVEIDKIIQKELTTGTLIGKIDKVQFSHQLVQIQWR